MALTPEAIISPEVESEWRDALNRTLLVIPLIVIDCQIPRSLNIYQYIDFRHDYDVGIALLRKRLHTLGVDSPEYLRTAQSALKVEQESAPDPSRFQPKIDALQSTIDNWDQRADMQHNRIAKGLEELRQQIEKESNHLHDQILPCVAGERLSSMEGNFKNRQEEQKKTSRLLADVSTRLVSVIGRGGMGKTALVGKVLQDLEQNKWPHTEDKIPIDGIVYLSTQTDGITLERLFLDCAKMLGGKQENSINAIWANPQIKIEKKISRLLEMLTNGLYVILLDNMEDILDDKGWIVDEDLRVFFDKFLTLRHNARLLVTSRIPLALQKEIMRFDHQVALMEGLPDKDGVALLRELDPNGHYGLRDATNKKLVKAVKLVHGIPRAIEIIASILSNDPFAQLDDILKRFFYHKDVVRDLVKENYRRLGNDTRRVMEALAVFKRPVPIVAIDYLLEPFFPGINVPDILRHLILTRIANSNRTNLGYSHMYLMHYEKAFDFLKQALPIIREIFDKRFEGWALEAMGRTYLSQNSIPEAIKHLNQALMIHKEINNRNGERQATEGLAEAYLRVNNYEKTIDSFKQASVIAHELGNQREEGRHLNDLGKTLLKMGKYEQAIEYFQKSLHVFETIGLKDHVKKVKVLMKETRTLISE